MFYFRLGFGFSSFRFRFGFCFYVRFGFGLCSFRFGFVFCIRFGFGCIFYTRLGIRLGLNFSSFYLSRFFSWLLFFLFIAFIIKKRRLLFFFHRFSVNFFDFLRLIFNFLSLF